MLLRLTVTCTINDSEEVVERLLLGSFAELKTLLFKAAVAALLGVVLQAPISDAWIGLQGAEVMRSAVDTALVDLLELKLTKLGPYVTNFPLEVRLLRLNELSELEFKETVGGLLYIPQVVPRDTMPVNLTGVDGPRVLRGEEDTALLRFELS